MHKQINSEIDIKGIKSFRPALTYMLLPICFFNPSMIFRVILPRLRLKKQQIYIFKYFFSKEASLLFNFSRI